MTNYVGLAQEHVANLYPLLSYNVPQLNKLPPGAIIGTWAYSVPGKIRFILARELELAKGVLPADVTRAWVRDVYALPFKRRRNQMERGFSVPLHAVRGNHGECSYVDIKGAYLRILSLGYDVEYRQGKYLGATPIQVPPEIAKNKFCYSIAIATSGTQVSKLQVMGNNGLFDHKPANLYSNPCLFNLAQDTLNGIGAEMLSVLGEHCVYMNTDGYIVHSSQEKLAQDIVQSWGFKSSVKHRGETEVRGVASWKVGNDQTKRFDHRAENFTGKLMSRDERRWLKRRWELWTPKLESVEKP